MLLACQVICARFCMTSSKRCSWVSRHDILDCSRTQYTIYAEFFTEVTGNEWDCATVCWQAVHVPGPLPSSTEPGASTCNVFRRIHTAHVRPERVVLTRQANVWKSWNFLTFLPIENYISDCYFLPISDQIWLSELCMRCKWYICAADMLLMGVYFFITWDQTETFG